MAGKRKWIVAGLGGILLVAIGMIAVWQLLPEPNDDVLIAQKFWTTDFQGSGSDWSYQTEVSIMERCDLIIRGTLKKMDPWEMETSVEGTSTYLYSADVYEVTISEVYHDAKKQYKKGDTVQFAEWAGSRAGDESYLKLITTNGIFFLASTIGEPFIEVAPYSMGDPFRHVVVIEDNRYTFYPVFESLMTDEMKAQQSAWEKRRDESQLTEKDSTQEGNKYKDEGLSFKEMFDDMINKYHGNR